MSYIDLHATLKDWPYDPEQVSVRKIVGGDGLTRIQMRVELGILQMEAEGRPDGTRPHGCTSLLDYHRKRHVKGDEANGKSGCNLSPQECQDLRAEASLFYRRFVALFVLEEFTEVVRDTAHNLALFDLCRDSARTAEDRAALEPFRPYVIMMDARARAYEAILDHHPASALAHVNRGILGIKAHFERRDEPDAANGCEEIKMLRALTGEVAAKMPPDSPLVTRRALRAAIEKEEFEEAARLRDALKNLSDRNP